MNLFLAVFLGNPGKEYSRTRHNYGWMLADRLPLTQPWTQKFKGETASWTAGSLKVHYLKPATFMNLSGESVRTCMDFYRVEPEKILAVHDDLELPLGETRFQVGGGLGGHNGLKSLEKHLGTRDFRRLRLGIGRPVHGTPGDYVLNRFTPEEEITLDQTLSRVCSGWEDLFLRWK